MQGLFRIITTAILLLFFGLAGIIGWKLFSFAYTPLEPKSKNPPIASGMVEINRSSTPQKISNQLQTLGLIKDADDFYWLGRITRKWGKLKAGEYQLTTQMSPMEIFSVISSGISVAFPLTIHEGDNIYQVGLAIEKLGLMTQSQFLEAAKSRELLRSLGFTDPLPNSIEGYLFPETYFLSRTTTAEEVIKKAYNRFKAHWTPEREAQAHARGMTRHQTVILASMIEKETGAPEERPLIGSVFHNRLRKKMRLQSDPTAIYGIWEQFNGNLSKKNLLESTPYNTYTIPALPVGPISNPGTHSIDAALNPAESEYLYFVSKNEGRHYFSKTFSEHDGAVKKFQLDRKMREGKSWRDMNKTDGTPALNSRPAGGTTPPRAQPMPRR